MLEEIYRTAIHVPKTLSVMLTFKCNAECKDCGTHSSPRSKGHVPYSQVERTIRQAAELGFANVVFTGGEVTLEYENLINAISLCRELGLPTRLVTNGHWASSQAEADSFMSCLIERGLQEINFSTGDEHVRFIPLSSIVHGCNAAITRGVRTALMIERREKRFPCREMLEREIQAVVGSAAFGRLFSIVESPWMPISWRRVSYAEEDTRANRQNLFSRGGCDSVLQTYVIQGDGQITACCGLGVRSIRELHVGSSLQPASLRSSIVKSESDWMKLAVRYIGPEKLLAFLSDRDSQIVWEDMYSHRCHACQRLYRDDHVRDAARKYLPALIPEIVAAMYVAERLVSRLAPTTSKEFTGREHANLLP